MRLLSYNWFRTVALASLAAFPALAQEGHPMSGVWVGDWGFDTQTRNRVVVALEWEGTQLSGTINPGKDAVAIKTAVVNPADWSLHVEADAGAAHWVLDGKIDDLGTYNRSINGSWSVDGRSGTFSITRQ